MADSSASKIIPHSMYITICSYHHAIVIGRPRLGLDALYAVVQDTYRRDGALEGNPMTTAYSDPTRADDMYALPDVEVFYHDGKRYSDDDCWSDGDGEPLPTGWYYWFCFPGCMPDSDPVGPYDTESAALEAAQDDAD